MLWPEFRLMLLGLLNSKHTRLGQHFRPSPTSDTEPSGGDPDDG